MHEGFRIVIKIHHTAARIRTLRQSKDRLTILAANREIAFGFLEKLRLVPKCKIRKTKYLELAPCMQSLLHIRSNVNGNEPEICTASTLVSF